LVRDFWSYSAGFFDGEGCISVQPHPTEQGFIRNVQFSAIITQKDDKILLWLKKNFRSRGYKFSIVYPPGWPITARSHLFTTSRLTTERFLTKIRKYTKSKRTQIKIVLDEIMPYYDSHKFSKIGPKRNPDGTFSNIEYVKSKPIRLNVIHLSKLIRKLRLCPDRRISKSKFTPNFFRKQLGFRVKK
jgi:hypothetical protein